MQGSEILRDALSQILPTAESHYAGKAESYITYFLYNEVEALHAENKPKAFTEYYQVDVWRRGRRVEEEQKTLIRNALYAAGFSGYSAQTFYERDTGIHHVAIRVNFTHETED